MFQEFYFEYFQLYLLLRRYLSTEDSIIEPRDMKRGLFPIAWIPIIETWPWNHSVYVLPEALEISYHPCYFQKIWGCVFVEKLISRFILSGKEELVLVSFYCYQAFVEIRSRWSYIQTETLFDLQNCQTWQDFRKFICLVLTLHFINKK